jgi:hypothetical protein
MQGKSFPPPDSNELKPSAVESEAEKVTESSVTITAPSYTMEENINVERYLEQASL